MKLKTIFIFSFMFVRMAYSQVNPILDTLYQSSYKVFQMLRTPTGLYKNQLNLTTNNDNVNASAGATGMGLISLCIADSMGWEKKADSLVLLTLKSLDGKTPGFKPARNINGYFPKLINPVTGANAEAAAYGTLDNAFLMSGILFCKKYFKNDSITTYANHLWKSIDWSKSIANAFNGELFTALDSVGTGSATLTKPYTEYILVAWLAKSQECFADKKGGPGRKLWNLFYNNPDSLPVRSTYRKIKIPTEVAGKFLPESSYITPYYLCNYYSGSLKYKAIMDSTRIADSLWWAATKLTKPYETGTSAGAAYSSIYSIDAINANIDSIVSPQALAGYSPIYAKAGANLTSLYKNNKGIYTLPGYPDNKVLWRYSILHPTWKAPVINAVDFATFLFGLAALPKYCGKKFFLDNNDFFGPAAAFTVDHSSFCSGGCTSFFDKSVGANLKYAWYFKGAEDTTSTLQNPVHICYKAAGTYPVKLTVTNGCSSDVLQLPVIVKAAPSEPVISQSTDTLFSTPAFSYQWFYNGNELTGEIKKDYKAAQNGNYTVCVTDTNGCSACSVPFVYVASAITTIAANEHLSIFPNPVTDFLEIKIPATLSKDIVLTLTDELGRTVENDIVQPSSIIKLDISRFSPGIYCLHASAEGFNEQDKIIKK